jgi:hypothetical protein
MAKDNDTKPCWFCKATSPGMSKVRYVTWRTVFDDGREERGYCVRNVCKDCLKSKRSKREGS